MFDSTSPIYARVKELEKLSRLDQTRISEDVFQAAYTAYYLVDPNQKYDALDIGANHGHHASRLGWLLRGGRGRVVAVEPIIEIAGLLAANIRHALLDNVIIEQKAVSDSIGKVNFTYNLQISQISRILDMPEEEKMAIEGTLLQPTDVVTIKWLIDRHRISPMIWKIDAECKDYEVLKGGEAEIKRLRPFICFEWAPQSNWNNFLFYDYFHSLGYAVMNCFGDILTREEWYHGEDYYFWNHFAIPRELDVKIIMSIRQSLSNLWKSYHPSIPF